jgi:hypothetical protein
LETKRRRDAWLLGHERAGWARQEAVELWERHEAKERARKARERKEAEEARRRQEQEWQARYEARLPILAAEREARERRRAEMQPVFDRVGGRGRWCFIERSRGRTFAAIGRDAGLHPAGVQQLCAKEARLDEKRLARWRARVWSRTEVNRGRPIDMGGPRDVWLHYGPSADPRLDNREPV